MNEWTDGWKIQSGCCWWWWWRWWSCCYLLLNKLLLLLNCFICEFCSFNIIVVTVLYCVVIITDMMIYELTHNQLFVVEFIYVHYFFAFLLTTIKFNLFQLTKQPTVNDSGSINNSSNQQFYNVFMWIFYI